MKKQRKQRKQMIQSTSHPDGLFENQPEQLLCQKCKNRQTGWEDINNIQNYVDKEGDCKCDEMIGHRDITSEFKTPRITRKKQKKRKQSKEPDLSEEDVENDEQSEFNLSDFKKRKQGNKNWNIEICHKFRMCLKQLSGRFQIDPKYYTDQRNNRKQLMKLLQCEELRPAISNIFKRELVKSMMEQHGRKKLQFNLRCLARLRTMFEQGNLTSFRLKKVS